LVVDPAAFVALGADDVQAAEFRDLAPRLLGLLLGLDALGRRLDDLTIALRQLREGLELLAQGRTPAPALWDAVYQDLLARCEPARRPDPNRTLRSEL
jgi:hypothetical protein